MREKLRRSPTLYRQLTVIAIITIAIPLFVMSAFLHYNAVNAYNRINKQAADTSMHDAYNKLELSFERIISLANKVASDNRVLGIMEKALTDDYPLDKRLDDVRLLRNTISSYENSEAGCSIRLVFPKHQSLLTNNGYTSITLATLKDVLAENDVQINDSTIISHPVWIGKSKFSSPSALFAFDGITYIRIIRNTTNWEQILGYIIVFEQYTAYNALLNKADITGESVFSVTDENGMPVILSGGANDALSLWRDYSVNKKRDDWSVFSRPLASNGWTLNLLLSNRIFSRAIARLTARTILVSIFLSVASVFLARRIYQHIVRRIKGIVLAMETTQQGNIDMRLPVRRNDELGSIEMHFNRMLDNLNTLMEQTAKMEEADRLLRIRLLRSQVNPHFLYNTLNSILWLAMDYNADKVCQMIKALSDFYKIGLQPGKDEATVAHELEHVQKYVALQSLRNEINIHLEMNVDESLYECRIPNMLLQPLVENSYVHGFFGRISGTISVTVQRSEDNIVLIVEDDGIGMSKDEIQRSLNNAQVENGYGIYSIVERVKLRYGSRASFSATSDNRNGCRIEIRLPYEC